MRAVVTFLTLAVLVISPNVCAAKALISVPPACHITEVSSVQAHDCCAQASSPSANSAMTCCPLAAEILKKQKISFEQFQMLRFELLLPQILTEISGEKNNYAPETPPLFTSRIFAKTYSSNSPPSILNFTVSRI